MPKRRLESSNHLDEDINDDSPEEGKLRSLVVAIGSDYIFYAGARVRRSMGGP